MGLITRSTLLHLPLIDLPNAPSVIAKLDGPIFNEAGIKNYTITSKWFYRYVVLINAGRTITKIQSSKITNNQML